MRSLSIFIIVFFLISGCNNTPDCKGLLEQIRTNLDSGNIKTVKLLADSIIKACPEEKQIISKADSFSLVAERIPFDFSLTNDQVREQLNERIGNFSPEEQAEWERKNWLECRMIDGEKRYFNRAASNLRLIRNFYTARAYYDSLASLEPDIITQRDNTESIIGESAKGASTAAPVEMTVDYRLVVSPDAVPDGETIRCWLPYPKENNPRQTRVSFISSSNREFTIAPDSMVHRTIYMEAKARKGDPVIFTVSYSYRSSGQYFDMHEIKELPYDSNSEIYRKYTAEQLPQICFTPEVRSLADSITGSETRPLEIIRKVYYWFSNNIPWAGALEYSIMPNIPEYVIRNRRGDCGMQTMLFMSILRYKGIPIRWQSGWKMTPGGKNLHDWSEVFIEGTGWIPVDISYGLQFSPDLKTREFFISGIDSYRLIVNDGISGKLFPEKRFLRSEPFDFQRGEVEWRGGNIYFDKWDYEMNITYNK